MRLATGSMSSGWKHAWCSLEHGASGLRCGSLKQIHQLEMTNMHKKAFTPENAAMLLIDHQVGTMAWTHSSDINLVKKNALRLARIAKAVDLPVVLTVSMEDQVQGP